MSSIEIVALEQARARLGPLINHVRNGDRVVITRNGNPVVELIAYRPDDPTGRAWPGPEAVDPLLTPVTRGWIAIVTDRVVAAEYAISDQTAIIEAMTAAIAAITDDLRGIYRFLTGGTAGDSHLATIATTVAERLLAAELRTRRCQCQLAAEYARRCDHYRQSGPCQAYTVPGGPTVDGRPVCATCFTANEETS